MPKANHYQKRKDENKCYYCGKVVENRVYCPDCVRDIYAKQKLRRKEMVAKGKEQIGLLSSSKKIMTKLWHPDPSQVAWSHRYTVGDKLTHSHVKGVGVVLEVTPGLTYDVLIDGKERMTWSDCFVSLFTEPKEQ